MQANIFFLLSTIPLVLSQKNLCNARDAPQCKPHQTWNSRHFINFLRPSAIAEFHTAHGQYLDYLYALEEEEPERLLYMAVPVKVYNDFFSLQFIQMVVQRSQLRLLIYNPEEEVITQWL